MSLARVVAYRPTYRRASSSSRVESSGTGARGDLKRAIAPFLCHSPLASGNEPAQRRGRKVEQPRKGRRARTQRLCEERARPAGRHTDPRYAAETPGRFRHDRRRARLRGEGPARAQFPRRARHAFAGLHLMQSCARMRLLMRAASSRSESRLVTESPWLPRPAPSSPPASSAQSMPAPGPYHCRFRPASAAATLTSSSSASS